MAYHAFQNIIQHCFEIYYFKIPDKVMLKIILMHMTEHTLQFFFSDSTLLDLGSAFNLYLLLGTCALVKQYAKHFHAYWFYTNPFFSFSLKQIMQFNNSTFKPLWMINVNTIHIFVKYTISYNSLIIPRIHFPIQ